MTVTLPFVVGADDMDAFAKLSGDLNPLHTDAAFARSKGYRDRVVYGGLLVAHISRLLGMHLPGRHGVWLSFELSFHQPLFIDQPARVTATVETLSQAARYVRVALEVTAENQRTASGLAEVVMRDNG